MLAKEKAIPVAALPILPTVFPRLWQQFECAIEDGVIQDGFVEFPLVDRSRRRDNRAGGERQRGGARGQAVGLTFRFGALRIAGEAEQGLQLGEELLLAATLHAIGVADADRHFIGKLALPEIIERLGSIGQRDALEEDVLIEPGQVRGVGPHGFGEAANMLAFTVVVAAIGEGGEQADCKNGAVGVHGVSLTNQAKRIFALRRPQLLGLNVTI